MMDDKTPNLNDTTPMQELSETLRPAVEQVRAATPPAEPVERTIDRAQQLGPPQRRRSRRWAGYGAAAGIAAAILVGFGLWPDQQRKAPEQVALNKHAKDKMHIRITEAGDIRDGTSNTLGFKSRKGEELSSDWGGLPDPRKDALPGMNAPPPRSGGGLGGALPNLDGKDIDGRSSSISGSDGL
ncbi:MAG: hypothetical protein ACRELF_25905, partial [Gemmataceae bacterium]